MSELAVVIGWDSREPAAYAVARASLMRTSGIEPRDLRLSDLRRRGLYTRPTEARDGKLWDVISDAPMATEFAISRFFVPFVVTRGPWALFTDCDVLFRADLRPLIDRAAWTPGKAAYVVKHEQTVIPGETKMDGQAQTFYRRKNWSSVMLWNLAHPAHTRLTLEVLNSVPGRDLHALCWLKDEEIGELPPGMNWLEGYSDPAIEARIAHFTRGTPDMPGHEHVPYADEWRWELSRAWAPGVAVREVA